MHRDRDHTSPAAAAVAVARERDARCALMTALPGDDRRVHGYTRAMPLPGALSTRSLIYALYTVLCTTHPMSCLQSLFRARVRSSPADEETAIPAKWPAIRNHSLALCYSSAAEQKIYLKVNHLYATMPRVYCRTDNIP